jgi:rhodanese-related sulfurtransferase
MAQLKSIPAQQLQQNGNLQQLEIIDVRTPVEFREVHVESARNIPLDRLDVNEYIDQRNGSKDQPLYLICRSGGRGKLACQRFLDAGFENVFNVEGGTEACVAAGLPVVRGKKAMSLERQVRIAAGSIVLAGSIAALVTGIPWLIAIPALIGAGLVIAAITDTCLMGMMIARMPWNQVNPSNTTCDLDSNSVQK